MHPVRIEKKRLQALERLEQKLDAIIRYFGIDPSLVDQELAQAGTAKAKPAEQPRSKSSATPSTHRTKES